MKRRALLYLAILLLLSVPRSGHAQEAEGAYQDRLLFADGLYSRGMYELAVREYAALLKDHPEGPSNDAATFRLAESLRQEGDLQTAGRFYAHVVVQYRDSEFRLRAAYRRARLYMQEGDREAALAHFEVILLEEPDPSLAAAARYYTGETYLQMEQIEAAETAFAHLIETHPDSTFTGYAWLKRAEILRDRLVDGLAQEADAETDALVAQAFSCYQQARAADESDPRLQAEVVFQMADIQFRLGHFEEASALYRELLADYPEDERAVQARLQAAWAALRSSLFAEALDIAEAALADGDKQADEWLYIKANSQRQLLQHEAAVATYAALLARFPDSRFGDPSRYERAVSHYQAGAYEEAVREAERIRLSPALREDVSWLLAESYAALGRRPEAIQYYRMVVREGGAGERARDALYRLGHQLQQQEAYREASQFYLQLVRQFPESALAPRALFASAFVLSKAGVHEEAVRDWRALVQQYPEHELVEEALYQRGMGEVRLERPADALATLDELLRRFPESRYLADAHYWRGMLQVETGRYAEAALALQRAIQQTSRESLRRDAQFQLGVVYQRMERDAEALALFDALLDTPTRDTFTPALLEWMAVQHGEREEYPAMIAAAMLMTPNEDPAWRQAGWVLVGRAYLAQGQQKAARGAFEDGLEQEDSKTVYAGEAAWQLGKLALAQEEADAAETYFRQATSLAGGEQGDAIRARALMGLGRAALLRGRRSDAARFFMSVAILYDDPVLVPESLYLAAEVFETLGRTEEREKVVAELAERYPDSQWASKARAAWQM